jgi:site-specific DNA recombinase
MTDYAIRPVFLSSYLLDTTLDAKRRPRPFDRILIDDTSRLARNLVDALKMFETLEFYEVGVTFVTEDIDTLSKMARQFVTFKG